MACVMVFVALVEKSHRRQKSREMRWGRRSRKSIRIHRQNIPSSFASLRPDLGICYVCVYEARNIAPTLRIVLLH
jgi:hypothetical protein